MPRNKDFDEDELLNKAMDLFWSKGYYATSANDLATALGIGKSSIYNTYTDKKTLFIKALTHYQAKNTGAVLNLLHNAAGADEAIKKILYGVIRESEEDTLTKGCFMVNTAVELSSHDQDIAQLVTQNNQSVEDALTSIIEKGQREGSFNSKGHPKAVARFIFSIINGLRVAARSGAGIDVLEDTVRTTLASLH